VTQSHGRNAGVAGSAGWAELAGDGASDDTAAPTANAAMAVHADVRGIPDMWFPFGHHECCY
jgi:hypothetical protein